MLPLWQRGVHFPPFSHPVTAVLFIEKIVLSFRYDFRYIFRQTCLKSVDDLRISLFVKSFPMIYVYSYSITKLFWSLFSVNAFVCVCCLPYTSVCVCIYTHACVICTYGCVLAAAQNWHQVAFPWLHSTLCTEALPLVELRLC